MAISYPIAETFGSIQGEGCYTGTPMFFIRLAGCNVGRFEQPEAIRSSHPPLGDLRVFNPRHSICTTHSGAKMLCDTNYFVTEHATATSLANRVGNYNHVCITGGEPCMHDLSELIETLSDFSEVHLETSGSKPLPQVAGLSWVTCSPKEGFNKDLLHTPEVDEWKLLVDDSVSIDYLLDFAARDNWSRPIYLQPVGGIHRHDDENLKRVLELLKTYTSFKLSAQLHKYLEVR